MTDQKSIFGVLVGLAALFLLWLWASGNAATLWAAATGTPTASTPTTGTATGAAQAAPNAGSFGTYGTANTVAQPTSYINTTPAAVIEVNPSSIGGYTVAGAQSGGVAVMPTVIANTNSIPSNASIDEANSLLSFLGLNSQANVVGGNAAPLA